MNQLEFDKQVLELTDAAKLYYQHSKESFLTDEEYDLKLEFLTEEVRNNPNLSTQEYVDLISKVAAGTDSNSEKKVKHLKPMLSLNKANSLAEVEQFLIDTSSFGADEFGWVLQAKLDGIAISAKYENGKLKQVATRGNGEVGEDITENLFSPDLKIVGLPEVLEDDLANFTGEIRGEALMKYSEFEEVVKRTEIVNSRITDENSLAASFGKYQVKPKPIPSNPRNTAAGSIKKLPIPNLPEELIVFDLETTGFNPKRDKIIEICFIKYVNGLAVDELVSFVDPEIPIPDIITKVTHITNDDVKNAPKIEELVSKIQEFIGNSPIAGQNIISFDVPFLQANGIKIDNLLIDSLTLSRFAFEGYRKHSLNDICNRFGINNLEAHRAKSDVIATYEAILLLYKKIKEDANTIDFFVYSGFEEEELAEAFNNSKQFQSIQKVTDSILEGAGCKTVCKNKEDVCKNILKFGEIRELGLLDFPTDGIVIKCSDDSEISKKMGETAHHPRSQIAFKYPPASQNTIIREIQIAVGRTGRITFRAKFDSVKLDGSIVSFATLHNASWLKERDVRVGSKVTITKANDIIPYVSAVLENPLNSSEFLLPDSCPVCKTELDKRTLLWRCPNDLCESRGVLALKTAVSRNYFDIDSLSIETLEALSKSGAVKDLADIFTLTEERLAKTWLVDEFGEYKKNKNGRYSTLGEVTAVKIYNSIQKAKLAPLEKILAALNIPQLGSQVAKNFARKYSSIEEILNLSIEELCEIELVSELKAKIFFDYFKLRTPLIKKLQAAGVVFDNSKYNNSFSFDKVLEGETIVISGEIPGMNRELAKEKIELLGGRTSESVSSKTTILVADESSTTSKVQKAKTLNVKIINPDVFAKEYLK